MLAPFSAGEWESWQNSGAMDLPVDALKPEIEATLAEPLVLIQAPPGTGKTTRVPLWLSELMPGQVIVLEPRRLAARWAARFVASQLGQRVGERVGYQVRFDDCTSSRTRVVYATEGILTRRMLRDPELEGVSCVVLDEFHERHLAGDLAFALLRGRKPLRVMSATPAPIEGVPVLRCEARQFPVDIEYLGEDRLADALRQSRGDTLVFLPGMAEIRRALPLAEKHGRALVLHGDLSPEEQDLAFQPCEQRRIVLATNVAESSVTVPGIVTVIDSGLARVAHSGSLRLERIPRSSAEQRAGRAGRTAPGRCIRLYSEKDFHGRPAFLEPEIRRLELSQTVLEVAMIGREPAWLDPPPQARWQAAVELCERLGALSGGAVTELGRRMSRYPLHPRLARLLEACPSPQAARVAAALSERHEGNGLDPLERRPRPEVVRQLERLVSVQAAPESVLRRALLAAFPDRVGRVRDLEVVLCGGGSATLPERVSHELVVVVELEERLDGTGRKRTARMVSPIEVEWLWEDFFELLSERSEPVLQDGRVWERRQTRYGELVLEERRLPASPGPRTAALLVAAARPLEEWEAWLARLATVRQAFPERELPAPDWTAAVARAAEQATSLEEVQQGVRRELARCDRLAPGSIDLPGRKKVKIHYELDRPPWVASRLQDFFGMTQGPRILEGRVALVLHLLAPNGRPVQVTTDLAGFWQRHYPAIRKQLCRRYPRHPWPEDPLAAR